MLVLEPSSETKDEIEMEIKQGEGVMVRKEEGHKKASERW